VIAEVLGPAQIIHMWASTAFDIHAMKPSWAMPGLYCAALQVFSAVHLDCLVQWHSYVGHIAEVGDGWEGFIPEGLFLVVDWAIFDCW
jgi:hypothetical protein